MTNGPVRIPSLAQRAPALRRWAMARHWEFLDGAQVAELLTDDWMGAGPLRLEEQLSSEYAHRFRTFFRVLDLAYLDRFPAVPEIQDLVPYWLWLLSQPAHRDAYLSADYFVQVFTPDPLDLDRAAAPARLRGLVQRRVFESLADFGLVEFRREDEGEREIGDQRFRLTPLFNRFVSFAPELPVVPPRRGGLRLVR